MFPSTQFLGSQEELTFKTKFFFGKQRSIGGQLREWLSLIQTLLWLLKAYRRMEMLFGLISWVFLVAKHSPCWSMLILNRTEFVILLARAGKTSSIVSFSLVPFLSAQIENWCSELVFLFLFPGASVLLLLFNPHPKTKKKKKKKKHILLVLVGVGGVEDEVR